MYDFNPYLPPLAIHDTPHRNAPIRHLTEYPHEGIRFLACILSIGGVLWGIFFALLIIISCGVALPFGLPGYAVTYGYFLRTCGYPSAAIRRTIWASSLLVQGGWLAFALVVCGPDEFLTLTFGILCVAWWAFATLASAIALYLDR